MRHNFPVLAAAGILLTGCASVTPASMVKLAGMDPLTADPASVAIAAVMPAALKLRSGDVVLQFSLEAPAPYGPVHETAGLDIVEGGATPGVAASPSFEHVQQARIAPRDVERLRAALARADAFRKSGHRDGKGSISVRVTGGCRNGPAGPLPLVTSIYMRRTPTEPFFPLVKDIDLRQAVGVEALAKLPPCAHG